MLLAGECGGELFVCWLISSVITILHHRQALPSGRKWFYFVSKCRTEW